MSCIYLYIQFLCLLTLSQPIHFCCKKAQSAFIFLIKKEVSQPCSATMAGLTYTFTLPTAHCVSPSFTRRGPRGATERCGCT